MLTYKNLKNKPNMKKFFLSTLLLSAMMVGCTSDPIEDQSGLDPVVEMREVTLTIAPETNADATSGVGTRLSMTENDTDAGVAYDIQFEVGDKLSAWSVGQDGNKDDLGEFTVESVDDNGYATITASLPDNVTSVYMVYPAYSDDCLWCVDGVGTECLSFDLSEQKLDYSDSDIDPFTKNNLCMISGNAFNPFDNSDKITMKHLFSITEVQVTYAKETALKIKSIEVQGWGENGATLENGFYCGDTYGEGDFATTTGDKTTKITFDTPVEVGGASTPPKFVFSNLAHTLEADQEVTVVVTFDDNSTYTKTKTITADQAALSFDRAEYCTISGIAIDDDAIVAAPAATDFTQLSAYSATSYPEGDTWTINDTNSDGTLTYADFEGLKYAIAAANGSDYIDGTSDTPAVSPTIIFAGLVDVPANALYNHTTALTPDDVYRSVDLSFAVELPVATSIGAGAFWGCESMTSIKGGLTDGGLDITTVETNAFRNCKLITSLNFPNATSMKTASVRGNSELVTVTAPEVETLAGNIFDACVKLVSLDLSNVTSIVGNEVFAGCTILETIDLSSLVSIAGYETFDNCKKLTSISLPKLSSITNSTTTANDSIVETFERCTLLTSITLGSEDSTVTDLDPTMFQDANSSATFSTSAVNLTIYAAGSSNIEVAANVLKLYTDNEKTGTPVEITFKTINGVDGSEPKPDAAYMISEFASMTDAASLPSSSDWQIWDTEVTTAELQALGEAIVLANSNEMTPNIIFSNLEVMPIGLGNLASASATACTGSFTVELSVATTLDTYAFAYCTGMTALKADSVSSIAACAFRNAGISTLSFPSAKVLAAQAFRYANGATTISLPNVTEMANNVFANLTLNNAVKLESLTLGTEGDGLTKTTSDTLYPFGDAAGEISDLTGVTLNVKIDGCTDATTNTNTCYSVSGSTLTINEVDTAFGTINVTYDTVTN